MRRIVADTMVLRYLILIDAVHILPALFEQVIIPPEVADELQHPHPRACMSPDDDSATIADCPAAQPLPRSHVARLGTGEHETILLMQEAAAILLVTDDRSVYGEVRRLCGRQWSQAPRHWTGPAGRDMVCATRVA